MQPDGSSKHRAGDAESFAQSDLEREVYGVLGVPIDAADMETVLRRIDTAVANRTPFLISTANLNFLIMSQSDPEFRASLLLSDLCTADGMPVVWVARLLGIPIRRRVAGSDIFEALKSASNPVQNLQVFLFGGAEGVAAAACEKLNSESDAVKCVGSFYPGFTTIDEMSLDAIIDNVNSSGADFLAVALGAKKGQAWLLRNHDRVQIPVRVHLGATINFQAGAVKRAPTRMREWGLEWLWRIKEEPQLRKRYWADATMFLNLVLTRVLPLLIVTQWSRLRWARKTQDLAIDEIEGEKSIVLNINGFAAAQNIGKAISCFQTAMASGKDVVINFTNTRLIDARFLGLLSVLGKDLGRRHLRLTFTGVPRRVERIFRLSGFRFLLRN